MNMTSTLIDDIIYVIKFSEVYFEEKAGFLGLSKQNGRKVQETGWLIW